jgi:hypothetical protein
LTVTCGWARGQKVKFLGFADTKAQRGLAITHVGPSTSVITGTAGRGDAFVELDREQLACWFRNLNPFPARIIVVHENQCRLGLTQLDDVDTLDKIANLGVRFLSQDHKRVCSRLKRMVAKHGEFVWVHYGLRAPVLVVGVVPHK